MRKRILNVIKIYVILLLVFIGYYYINKYTGFYIPCIIREITGFKCPGCGITHCLFAIYNLNFKEAFYHNPLVFIYLPFIVAYFIYETYLYIYDKSDKILVKIPKVFEIILILITILYGVFRNIISI